MDVLDPALSIIFQAGRFDTVFHLAANSDILAGNSDNTLDLRLNYMTTVAILDAMLVNNVHHLFLASTSAVFGEVDGPLREDSAPMKPISFYGASKLAAEAYASAFAHIFGIAVTILRFPNVVGERATHGILYDFLRKLKANNAVLDVIVDGSQTKPYLSVASVICA